MAKFVKFTCGEPSIVTTVTKLLPLENKWTDLFGAFKIHNSQQAFLPCFFQVFHSSRRPWQSKSFCFTRNENENFFFHVKITGLFQLSPVAAELFQRNETRESSLADFTKTTTVHSFHQFQRAVLTSKLRTFLSICYQPVSLAEKEGLLGARKSSFASLMGKKKKNRKKERVTIRKEYSKSCRPLNLKPSWMEHNFH